MKEQPLMAVRKNGAFALSEMLVAMLIWTMILGAVLTTVLSLQRSFSASDHFSANQLAQLRLMNALTRDIRNAIGIRTTNEGILRAGATVTITSGNSLQLTLRDFYRSNNPASPDYDDMRTPIATNSSERISYGDPATDTPAPDRAATYTFLNGAAGTMTITRSTVDGAEIIAEETSITAVELSLASDYQVRIHVNHGSQFGGGQAGIANARTLIMRNVRYDL